MVAFEITTLWVHYIIQMMLHFLLPLPVLFAICLTQLVRFAMCGTGNEAKFSFLVCIPLLTHDISDSEHIISMKKDLLSIESLV